MQSRTLKQGVIDAGGLCAVAIAQEPDDVMCWCACELSHAIVGRTLDPQGALLLRAGASFLRPGVVAPA